MGNGTFVDVATQTMDWVNHVNADTHGAAWADVYNNGQQVLLAVHRPRSSARLARA